MKKVAIITIQSRNYGNRLQNYALQEIIKSFGLQVDTLRRGKKPKRKEQIKRNFKYFFQKLLKTKGAKFTRFEKNIKKSSLYITANNAPKELNDKYDYFVVGSDQVWNPYYEFLGKVDLLYFADNRKKIAYAASFGVDELPDSEEVKYKKYLKKFASISVREEAGAKIVNALIEENVPVVLDPTMLLSASQWEKVEKKPECFPKQKYVLIYSLGTRSQEFKDTIAKVKEKKCYRVIDILERKHNGLEYPIGPAEFIFMLHYAELILTDSFHAAVFSILFHKKVQVFNREDQKLNSRIINLFKMCGLEKNMKIGCFDIGGTEDFSIVDEKIEINKKKSIDYLKKSLSINEVSP